ncbi:MAG: DNA repair protein RadC [Flavobacteriales bacterium]
MHSLKGIKTWNADDRPREKLVSRGAQSLSDAELMAILLGSGSRNESAVELSRRILQSAGNDLVSLGNMGLSELQKFKGMGEAKSVTVMAALELSKRRRSTEARQLAKTVTPAMAYEIFLQHLDGLKHEEFWMMGLNRKLHLIGLRKISEGGLASTVVDVKKIFRLALEMNSGSIIVGHNHPSGSALPSREDDGVTKKIKDAGKLLDCHLCDHIIVTDTNYFSYSDSGSLEIL